MSPREAFELAQELIDHYDDVDVIAVGRFVPMEQATSSTPWAISVSIDGSDRPTVIRDASDLREICKPKPKVDRKPTRPAPTKPAMQESLF